ncbi:hypothetical protein M378DRAFT_26115 [Amanita muscaria Koide BX008]|uniref:Sister chromatid cohesion protein n=1 Tax=Amanita muscaria (strain Koide BX008) TaxID=946122 RepID=A0A0C2T4B1_AMAMK|nr:hypothetical protein M378DRAFT_26115 [Amanita muscaria Koide BX008]
MDSGQGWHRNQQQTNPTYYYQQHPHPSPNHHHTPQAAVESVHDAQRLLAVYPPASATPTAHVARHLSHMTFTAAPPTFVEPSYYAAQHQTYAREPNPPPYTEYAHELSYISSAPKVPNNDGGYWENTRNDAARLLGDHSNSRYSSQPSSYHTPSPWPQYSVSSAYQPSYFAQSVIQRTVPTSVYPTPSPQPIPSSSSSSLAFALGMPEPAPLRNVPASPAPVSHLAPLHSPQPKLVYQTAPSLTSHAPLQQSPPKVYKPEESPMFFNNFLAQTSRQIKELDMNEIIIQPVSIPSNTLEVESPDPLRLISSPGNSPMEVTPRKRKALVDIESPSIKRIQVLKSHLDEFPRVHTPKKSQTQTSPLKQSVVPRTPSEKSYRSDETMCTPSHRSPSTPTSTSKKLVMAYVAVPPPPSYLTPSSHKGSPTKSGRVKPLNLDGTPDLGGYGSEEESPTLRRGLGSVLKSSARRTGDRDERPPLEKFVSLISGIFDAEDSLAPDTSDVVDLPSDFFSHLSADGSRPLLASNVIRKLINYIGHIARPTKRDRTKTTAGGVPGSGALNTPRSKGRMTEIETQVLSRLMKTLERSVKAGEDLDPFCTGSYHGNLGTSSGREGTASPKKKKKAPSKKTERTAKSQEDAEDTVVADVNEEEQQSQRERSQELQEVDYEQLTKMLELARDSVLAADCCIALLGSDRLPKQLYAEELITTCLGTIKNQLTKIIYPFVEATSSALSNMAPALHQIVQNSSSHSQGHRRQLSEIFQALSSVLPRVNNLINTESIAMSDTIIIQAVYIAIGPFFVVESGQAGGYGDGDGDKGRKKDKGSKENIVIRMFGKSAMRGLRLDALSLIRTIFANHEDQRSWIIEEILNSLIKLSDIKQKAGQFRLRDGRSITTVSALLLQLVQTSAHDVRLEARRIEKARQQSNALRRQESFSESQSQSRRAQQEEDFLDEHDQEEIRLYASGLDSATKAAKTIIAFLTQRSGKGKAVKNTNEAEYRTIFDNLISDLLVVLYWPEWPAASLLLSVACRFMVESSNAAKTIALDHLGVVAARLRSCMLKVRQRHSTPEEKEGQREKVKSTVLKPLEEIASNIDFRGLESKRSSEDQAYDSARELTAATFGRELAAALKQVWHFGYRSKSGRRLKDRGELHEFGNKLKVALREEWKDSGTDVFDIGSQEEAARVDRLAEEIGTTSILRNSFQPLLGTILLALDAAPIFMRTKALRALGQIVMSDATILSTPNVRRAIESHLIDSSPAVRDAAVELIGKYMVDSPEVAGDYYSKIAERIADTGLGVRKRVIKLLKSIYTVTEDNQRRIDIATRLVLRMLDEDDTVKELAIRTIEELWFPSAIAANAQSSTRTRAFAPTGLAPDKALLQSQVVVIMGAAANFKNRQSPLEDILHKIMSEKEGADVTALHARYSEICETLIDGLVDASDLPGFTVVNCIRTIYLFTSAHPPILSPSNASTLLPYLKNASSTEELTTSDYLLKIFRVSIPHMPKTAAKFGQELQSALQPMILKPSGGGGTNVLQESVACMCVVVQHLTHDFTRLVNLMKSCNGRIQQAIRKPKSQASDANDVRALLLVVLIAALLVEHCDFDRLRSEDESLALDIDSISRGSIVDLAYISLIQLYEKYDNASLQTRLLQCLGFLFRAQPTLMIKEQSSAIMDSIITSSDPEVQGRLLKIIQEFLTSEAEKHSTAQKEKVKSNNSVNMEELVGNTDGFADSGVSSAVVQRYLNPILEAALAKHAQLQGTAIDILTFTIKQGLAHPLQSFPVIIALETSPVSTISNRAVALHAILHGKHASLLNTRYALSARTSFDYQKKICANGVQGFRRQPIPTALLQCWYTLVREKRPTRQDFLKSLVKVFQDNPSYQSSQDDVDFMRYMAENFATLEYKTQEEVLTVIKHLTAILSTTGMQILELISPSHLLAQLRSPSKSSSQTTQEIRNHEEPLKSLDETKMPLMRTSVIISMVMLLKAHLKSLYSLSEDKCNKFVVGKKSTIGDKAATKRHENLISWERLPFATAPIMTVEDVEAQRTRFLDIWNEDGVNGEPEDDMEL